MEDEAEKMKEEDQRTQKLIQLKNKSESLIFATEDLISEQKEKLPKDTVKEIEVMSAKLQELMENSQDPDEIQEAYEELDKAGQKISEILYG